MSGHPRDGKLSPTSWSRDDERNYTRRIGDEPRDGVGGRYLFSLVFTGRHSATINNGVPKRGFRGDRGNQKGGALSTITVSCQSEKSGVTAGYPCETDNQAPWYVLWTRSHCEQLVHDQLSAKGFESFLPKISQWSRRQGVRQLVRAPMFPGYLFLRHEFLDKTNYIEVSKTKGLVRILGERWDHLGTVPYREMDAIKKVIEAELPAMPHPYLREGQRVRVARGPLANAEGILVKSEPKRGVLVLSVDLLRRSVGVEIDCTLVNPV